MFCKRCESEIVFVLICTLAEQFPVHKSYKMSESTLSCIGNLEENTYLSHIHLVVCIMHLKTVEERFRDFQTKSYHKNAKAPPVRSKGMAFTTDYLGSHILDGTTKGIGLVFQILLG